MSAAPRQPPTEAELRAAASVVVTDEILEAALEAEREAFAAYVHDHAGGDVSHTAARRQSIRAAVEVALVRAIPAMVADIIVRDLHCAVGAAITHSLDPNKVTK